jgi:integrase
MKNQRSILLFEEAIKSPATKKMYLYQIEKFRTWAKIKDFDSLLQAPTKNIQELLEDYVFNMKRDVSPNSIPVYFAPLELFFVMNDVNLNFKKIRKLFPAKIKKGNNEAYSLKEIQKLLSHARTLRNKSLVLLLASSGCRIGAVSDIKLKHMLKIENSYCITIYEGEVEEDFIFTTPETTEVIDEYLNARKKDGEYVDLESPLFRSIYRLGIEKVRPCTIDALSHTVGRLVTILERKKVGKTNRFSVARNHGFRKFYATAIKDVEGVSPTMTEKLINHIGVVQLDGSYYKPTKEKMFEAYKKCIDVLTIDDSKRHETKLEKVIKEKSELENVNHVLKETVKEKDSIARKYRDAVLNTKITDDAINKRIEDLLNQRKNNR